jgi:hypothetical protein
MEGYKNNGKIVDTAWWLSQISLGEEDRNRRLKRSLWPTYMHHYRNEYDSNLYPKNMFFVLARTIVPKIYYRNPKISIVPKQPGPKYQAFSKVLERVDNILIDAMNLKVEMKRMVNAAFFQSMGVMKLLFGAEYTPTPIAGITAPPITKDGMRPEYHPGIVQNMPFAKHISADEFIMAENVRDFEDSFFQAHKITRYWDDLENDPRFPEFKKHARKPAGVTPMGPNDASFAQNHSRRMVELIEIRDRRNRKVILLAPDAMPKDTPLLFKDDELQTAYSSPFYIFTPNIDVEHPYGVSDADILLTAQEQLNDIKTKIHRHAKLSIIKWLSEQSAITEAEAEKLLNEDIGAVIQVANIKRIQIVESHHIPDALLAQEREIMEDMRELIGFSRNSMAQFQTRGSHGPTATEVNAVNAAAELRIDERRDMIADNIVSIFKDVHRIIFRHWDQSQVVQLVGDDGLPIWVEFTGKMLEEGSYDIAIEPDSSVPETREVRENRASRLYQEMIGDPNIDPKKLTEYRLHETPGVAMDDLMRSDIPPAGGNVLSMQDFINQQPQLPGAQAI